jgi:hypothetical protein
VSDIRAPESRRQVVEMRRRGCSIPEIAEAMGWSSGTVVTKHLRRHGDPELLRHIKRRPKPDPAWWDQAEQLCRSGLADHVVAQRLGKGATTVLMVRRRRGVPANPRHLTRSA